MWTSLLLRGLLLAVILLLAAGVSAWFAVYLYKAGYKLAAHDRHADVLASDTRSLRPLELPSGTHEGPGRHL